MSHRQEEPDVAVNMNTIVVLLLLILLGVILLLFGVDFSN
jgi:hypothetical protein